MRTTFVCFLICSIGAAIAADLKPIRFEVEDCTTPKSAWLKNGRSPKKWNLWSTDVNKKNWSKGVVLQGPVITEDREPGKGGAPVLHTVITKIPEGTYDIHINGTRTIGISFDGKTWKPSNGGSIAEKLEIKNGKFELWVDDCYKNRNGEPGACYYDFIEFRPRRKFKARNWPKVNGWAKRRPQEKLDRGTVAIKTPEGVYIGWRLLKNDPKDIAFDVYRFDNGMTTKLNKKPIQQTTDFQDVAATTDVSATAYAVCKAGAQPDKRDAVRVADKARNQLPYVSIPLRDPRMRFNRIAIADLNGDGKLDYVIKHPNSSIDPWYKFWKPSPGTYKIEAYRHDGKHMWTRDLGWSIEQGIWYSPYIVADLTGDGKAEVAVKTGEGDPRDKDGKVRTGPENLSIWNGETGKDITKIAWPSRGGYTMNRGYNYASRNMIAVAYLDGKTPCVIALRGTYNRMMAHAYMLKGGKLKSLWKYDNEGLGKEYWGQGEHFTHAIDVDNDGRDEVMLGSVMLDDNGAPLWTTGLGHNDAGYVGDLDPTRPGLEIFYIIETRKQKNGMCMVDAATGKILWGYDKPTSHVHSAGMCSDIDPLHPGSEGFGMDKHSDGSLTGPWLWSAQGKLLAFESSDLPKSHDMQTAFWDADLQRECIRKYPMDYLGGKVDMRPYGRTVLTADVLGDWREEIITTMPGEIRIYSTTIPAMDRRACLLQDKIYRADVRMATSGYTKLPTLSYSPIAQSPNVNLTVMKDPKGSHYCRVVVSAPAQSRLKGTLHVEGKGLSKGQEHFGVNVAPGELKVFRAELTGSAQASIGTTFIHARLETTKGKILRGRVPMAVRKTIPKQFRTSVQRMEAETIRSQGGGKVYIRSDKQYVSGKCISHWDKTGHWLEWTFSVKQAGTYELGIRYATNREAKRRISLNGITLGELKLPGTGGFGDSKVEWTILRVSHKQLSKMPRLAPGKHTLRMENIGNTPMNLDFVSFQRMK